MEKLNFKNGFGLGTIVAIVLMFTVFLSLKRETKKDNSSVQKIDDIVIYLNQNDSTQLSELTSKSFYLINYWATWCKPCIEELPTLDKLASNLEYLDILIIGISNEKEERLAFNFIETKPTNNFNLYYQYTNTPKSILPYTILLNQKGEILWSKTGKLSNDIEDLKQIIESKIQ